MDDDRQIGFVWTPPSNAEMAVTYYRVYLSVDGAAFRYEGTTTFPHYVVEGDSGRCYRLRVAGVNIMDQEGRLSPESEEVWCLPQDPTAIVFDFATVEGQEMAGKLKLVWETTGYLDPNSFQVRRKGFQSSEECLLEAEILEDFASAADRFRYWCSDRSVVVGETYRYTIQAMDPSGNGVLAISICAHVTGPVDYRLYQNHPNPFNAETTLSYQNPEANRVVLTIYNAQGQKVRTLLDAYEAPGLHLVHWDGTDHTGLPVASGVYFCHMWSGKFTDVKKVAVIR